MDIEQFRATRRAVSDLDGELGLGVPEMAGKPGLVYAGGLYVESRPPGPEGLDWINNYFLCLGNLQWVSDDLAELEVRLHEFVSASGFSGNGGSSDRR